MSKKILLSTLLSLTALASIFTSLPVQAQEPLLDNQFIVTSRKGLNLRDQNCKVIEVLAYGSVLEGYGELSKPNYLKSCNIGGVNYKVSPVVSPSKQIGYVAEQFTTRIYNGSIASNGDVIFPWTEKDIVKVAAKAGLNLRDENCRKITTLPYNYSLQVNKNDKINKIFSSRNEDEIDNRFICQASNQYYVMASVFYNGKNYYVANSFLS